MQEKVRQSWTLLAIEGRRQHGGNTGYQDNPASVYHYDSGIPNSSNVKQGDLVFVRDGDGLLGVALVEEIISASGTKELLKCPVCGRSGFRERRNMSPVYRCFSGHTFDEPGRKTRAVIRYEARYGGTYVPASGAVTGPQLRAAAWRPNAQLSIEEVNAASLADAIVRAAPAARTILEAYFQGMVPESVPRREENEFVSPLGDRRQKILASISQRRGQRKFRDSLLRRYGARCVISGCTLMEIVEAAHLWPYRGKEDNHPQNGLLLRADLHTLYDLDLVGIDPGLRVSIAPQLRGSEYERFEGTRLALTAKPSIRAITARWETFRAAHAR